MVKKVFIYLNVFILGALAALFYAKENPELVVPELKVALEQCLVEVEKGCPMLMGYALDLEKENSRLNRLIKTSCLCAP